LSSIFWFWFPFSLAFNTINQGRGGRKRNLVITKVFLSSCEILARTYTPTTHSIIVIRHISNSLCHEIRIQGKWFPFNILKHQ
jgi:hypothetical protein